MSDILILGGAGFVGSAIARACAARGLAHEVITRASYADLAGQSCRLFINANGNSRKPLARQAPLEDFEASVRSVRASLEDFRFDLYVHLSSCDVYPDCSSPETTGEDGSIDVARQSPYGFHKYLAEQCVHHRARHHLILRLGGFVGPGLRKNAIFDILHGGPLWLDPESDLQFLSTDAAAEILLELAAQHAGGSELYNLCGAGVVRLSEVMEQAGAGNLAVQPGSPRVRYDVSVAKVSRRVALPSSRETVFGFVREQLDAT